MPFFISAQKKPQPKSAVLLHSQWPRPPSWPGGIGQVTGWTCTIAGADTCRCRLLPTCCAAGEL